LVGEEATAFVAIYEGSFPAAERDHSESVLASIEAGERLCQVALVGDQLVGLAVLLPLRGLAMMYLEYLAVDSAWRNRKIGSRLLAQIRELSQIASGPVEGVVFEVEPPAAATGSDRTIRERRISMYLRNGAVIVEGAPHYRAPSLAGDGTLPFTLMWLPVGASAATLEGSRLRACTLAILTQGYELPADDPLVVSVVDGLIS
jgi:GNAT superfamily N-acetyltransferase